VFRKVGNILSGQVIAALIGAGATIFAAVIAVVVAEKLRDRSSSTYREGGNASGSRRMEVFMFPTKLTLKNGLRMADF
jgi:hypothetical protein